MYEFGDFEELVFFIYKLLEVGKGYGLVVGLWVGSYVMCRVWEILVRSEKEEVNKVFLFVVYIVFGDEDGERGGVLVVCVEDVSSRCFEYFGG